MCVLYLRYNVFVINNLVKVIQFSCSQLQNWPRPITIVGYLVFYLLFHCFPDNTQHRKPAMTFGDASRIVAVFNSTRETCVRDVEDCVIDAVESGSRCDVKQ